MQVILSGGILLVDTPPEIFLTELSFMAAEVESVRMAGIGGLPLGVAILAILVGIFGFFVFLVGIFLLVGVALGGVAVTSVFGVTGTLADIIILVIGLVILGVAVGLWNQELWALVLAILVLLVYAALEFVSASWLGLIVVVLLLIYLVAVARHFD